MNTEAVIREYLPQIIHLSLATVSGDIPWVCELYFAYDDNLNLYFSSQQSGRHSQELTTNPKVAGSIVRQHADGEAPLGIYFEGQAKLLAAGTEQDLAFDCIKERFADGDEILVEGKQPDGHQFYKIAVGTYYLFGSFEGGKSRKFELAWHGGDV